MEEEQDIRNDWIANYTGDPKDRTRKVPLERSIAYLESDAYRQTYGKQRVKICILNNYLDGR